MENRNQSHKVSLLYDNRDLMLYSGFEVTCPDCDLQSALDHAARDK